MKYFQDNCQKRSPSKEYFWMVYSILKPNEYVQIVQKVVQNARRNVEITDSMALTPELALFFITQSTTLTPLHTTVSL